MPAAAVIPAPIAYTKVVAVKKLVVGFLVVAIGPPSTGCVLRLPLPSLRTTYLTLNCRVRYPHHLL